MFHAMFLVMQKDLNFTATLHKRKDGKWGPTLVLPNGTIEAHGIISSLTTGYAEMIVTRYVFFILKKIPKCRIDCTLDTGKYFQKGSFKAWFFNAYSKIKNPKVGSFLRDPEDLEDLRSQKKLIFQNAQ